MIFNLIDLEVAFMRSKREHESFEMMVSEDGQYFTESYDGGLVIQTLDAYRAKNPKEVKQTHGCEGEQDDAYILARYMAGTRLKRIYNTAIDGKVYSKGKVDLAVSIRYKDDPERILDLFRKFTRIFQDNGIASEVEVLKWVTKKRDRYRELGKLIDKPNPKRPRKCTVTIHEEVQEPADNANWISRDGETVFLNAKNILVMKKPSNLELVDKNSLANNKENDEKIEQLRKQLDDARIKIAELEATLSEKEKQLNIDKSRIDGLNKSLQSMESKYYESNGKVKVLESELDKANEKLAILFCYFGADRQLSPDAVISASNRAIGYFGGLTKSRKVLGDGGKAILSVLTANPDIFLAEVKGNAKDVEDYECVGVIEPDNSTDSVSNTSEERYYFSEDSEESKERLNNSLDNLFLKQNH